MMPKSDSVLLEQVEKYKKFFLVIIGVGGQSVYNANMLRIARLHLINEYTYENLSVHAHFLFVVYSETFVPPNA